MRGIPTITMKRHYELMKADLDYPVWLRKNTKSLGRVQQLWPLDESLTMWRAMAIFDEEGNSYGHNDDGSPIRRGIILSTTPAKPWWLQPDQGDD